MAKTVYGEILSLPNIKGLWRLNNNANDDSGNGNNGTPANVTFNLEDFVYNAEFNGSTSKIEVPAVADLLPTSTFSIGFWVKMTSFVLQTQMVRFGGYAVGGIRFGIAGSISIPVIFASIIDSTNTHYSQLQFTVNQINFLDGKKHFVALVFTPGSPNHDLRFYIDGRRGITLPLASDNQPSYGGTPRVSFGTALQSGGSMVEPWAGKLEEIFLLNGYALSIGEVRRIYAQGRGLLI